MRTNHTGEFGYTRQPARRNEELERAAIELAALKSELRITIGREAANEFIASLPGNLYEDIAILEAELTTYVCTCGVTWGDPCSGCKKRYATRKESNDLVDSVLDALVDF